MHSVVLKGIAKVPSQKVARQPKCFSFFFFFRQASSNLLDSSTMLFAQNSSIFFFTEQCTSSCNRYLVLDLRSYFRPSLVSTGAPPLLQVFGRLRSWPLTRSVLLPVPTMMHRRGSACSLFWYLPQSTQRTTTRSVITLQG